MNRYPIYIFIYVHICLVYKIQNMITKKRKKKKSKLRHTFIQSSFSGNGKFSYRHYLK